MLLAAVLGTAVRLGRAAVLRRLAELVTAGRALLRCAPLVLLLLLLLLLLRCAPLVLRRRVLLVLLRGVLVLLRRELLVLRRELLVLWRELLVGRRILLLLLLRCAPLVLLRLLLLGHAPGVRRLLHRSLAAALLLRLPVRCLPVLTLPVLRLALPVLVGGLLLGHGRPPAVRLLLLLRRLAPWVGRLPGRALLLGRPLVLRALLLVGVGRLLVRLAARLPRRGAVLRLAALRLARWRKAPVLVVVPARARPLGAARTGEVGPAAHAEQIALLERFVTDRTVQGRHDTSPERTPARSSLDVRCSMSPLRGIPM
ncbi:hypothetical protein BZB76_4788 [Actinomadura pelletieri DSM 43383]|uniref:Uncharacterized protein n=1 Tax=Actinomadura pelletieri DSM 43383 TaxID=1120940 RepID=A0A495QIK8_9ACTN|nr:hypothetical protein BZB76_4788 [Actinomadura pelletieri DSM 43383]